jgi:hypothetical protein
LDSEITQEEHIWEAAEGYGEHFADFEGGKSCSMYVTDSVSVMYIRVRWIQASCRPF